MNEFEKILQECLLALERGETTVQECLSRHPNYASLLEPILLTSVDLEGGRVVRPSAAFKSRVRARLTQEMRAYPRKRRRFNFMFMRLATSFAVLLLAFLMVGTAYAQSALPGEAFYKWKLASENLWRAVTPDPIGMDLAIAERRAAELIALDDHSEQRAQVLEAYLEVIHRLELAINAENEARIRSILDAQIEELNAVGIFLQPVEQDVSPTSEEPTPIPTQTPLVPSVIPDVNPTLPVSTSIPIQEETVEVILSPLPNIVPSVEVPPLLP